MSTATDYPAIAAEFAGRQRPLLNLDFSEASVVVLDLFIDETWGTAGEAPGDAVFKPSPERRELILQLGIYFGEVLRRLTGGRWVADPREPANPLMTTIRIPPELNVYAVSKAWKRFKNGREDTLHPLLEAARGRSPGTAATAKELPAWLSQADFFRARRRFDVAVRLYDHALGLGLPANALADVRRKRAEAERDRHAATARVASESPPTATPVPTAALRKVDEPPRERQAVPPRAPVPPLENDLPSMLERARRLAGAGNTPEAVAAYRKTIEAHPGALEAWRELGVGLSLMGKLDDALAAFEHVTRQAPGDLSAWDYQAVTLGRAGRFVEGLARIEAGITSNPGGAILFARRAFFCSKLQQFQDARASAQRAVSLDPSEVHGYAALAEAERHLGNRQGAIAALQQMVRVIRPQAWKLRVQVLRELHGLAQPEAPLDPSGAERLQEEAFGLVRQGKTVDAARAFQRATELDPYNLELWHNRAVLAAKTGWHDQALTFFDRALAINPAWSPSALGKAASLVTLARKGEAIAALDDHLRAAPGSLDVQKYRARVLLSCGRHTEAVAAYEALARTAELDAEAQGWFATSLARVGRLEDALAHYNRAIARSGDKDLLLAKAIVLRELGRGDEARVLSDEAFSDKEFEDRYLREGLEILELLTGKPRAALN